MELRVFYNILTNNRNRVENLDMRPGPTRILEISLMDQEYKSMSLGFGMGNILLVEFFVGQVISLFDEQSNFHKLVAFGSGFNCRCRRVDVEGRRKKSGNN